MSWSMSIQLKGFMSHNLSGIVAREPRHTFCTFYREEYRRLPSEQAQSLHNFHDFQNAPGSSNSCGALLVVVC